MKEVKKAEKTAKQVVEDAKKGVTNTCNQRDLCMMRY